MFGTSKGYGVSESMHTAATTIKQTITGLGHRPNKGRVFRIVAAPHPLSWHGVGWRLILVRLPLWDEGVGWGGLLREVAGWGGGR